MRYLKESASVTLVCRSLVVGSPLPHGNVGKAMVAKPGVQNSLIGCPATVGQSRGSLPLIIA